MFYFNFIDELTRYGPVFALLVRIVETKCLVTEMTVL